MPAQTDAARRRYSSRIIKAGALLADTKTLLAVWDPQLTSGENLSCVRASNLFGKSSRARIDDILAIFQQRYLRDPAVTAALSTLVLGGVPSPVLDPIFYFHATQSDRLLHDAATDLLASMYWQGRRDVDVGDVEAFIQRQVREGMTQSDWSEATIRRVAQGILATLRDFGVLSGAAKKQLPALALPVSAFAFLAFALYQQLRAGDRLIKSPEWRLFFLQPDLVERLLVEAHQEHLLQFSSAGRVTRLDFPADSLEGYARAIAQRTH